MFRTIPKTAANRDSKTEARNKYRMLWVRVIYQAVEDLGHPKPAVRASAESFLSGASGALKTICTAIGLNDSVILKGFYNGTFKKLQTMLRKKSL